MRKLAYDSSAKGALFAGARGQYNCERGMSPTL
jgi:hypothetical protein